MLKGLPAALLLGLGAAAAVAAPDPGHALLDQYAKLKSERPALGDGLYVISHQSGNEAGGEVFGLTDLPFATAEARLRDPQTWCDILFLHYNVKACTHSGTGRDSGLVLYLGRKYFQPLYKAYKVPGRFRIVAVTDDFLRVAVGAPQGPLGLDGYRITLQATPDGQGRTLLHFTYSFNYGDLASWAMQGYFATFGRDKIGFSRDRATGEPVAGIQGMVERNAMRYYLAIEAYAHTLSVPAERRLDARLKDWFALTARYPRRLKEMDEKQYLTQKHKELAQARRELPDRRPGPAPLERGGAASP